MITPRFWAILKLVLAIAILLAVARHFSQILQNQEFDLNALQSGWLWLIPAGLAYILAHTIWGTFWWLLLRNQSIAVGWRLALRTYFISQFGKYLPGKVMVLIMRVGMLRQVPGATRTAILITAIYETLVSMGAGAFLAAVLFPTTGVFGSQTGTRLPWFMAVAGLPLLLGMVNRLGARAVRRRSGPDAPPFPSPSLGLLSLGLLQACFGWCLLAFSLHCVLEAIAPADRPMLAEWPADMATVAASYVAGFVFLVSPGGLGPREFVLQELLSHRTGGPGPAVVAALLLRLIWTLFEVMVAGGCYLFGPRASQNAE